MYEQKYYVESFEPNSHVLKYSSSFSHFNTIQNMKQPQKLNFLTFFSHRFKTSTENFQLTTNSPMHSEFIIYDLLTEFSSQVYHVCVTDNKSVMRKLRALYFLILPKKIASSGFWRLYFCTGINYKLNQYEKYKIIFYNNDNRNFQVEDETKDQYVIKITKM